MTDSEIPGSIAEEHINHPFSNHSDLISSRTYKTYSEGILGSLEVSQSKMVELVQDKINESQVKLVNNQITECESCEAWQQWSLQSEQTMLLIQKKLIQQQKILHQRIKSLQKQAEQKSKAYEKLERESEQQKTRDRKTIDQLMLTVQELKKSLKNMRASTKVERSYKSSNNYEVYNVVKEEDDQNCQQGFTTQKQNIKNYYMQGCYGAKTDNFDLDVSLNLAKNSNEHRQYNQQDYSSLSKNKLASISKNSLIQTVPSLSRPESKGKVQISESLQNLKTSKSEYLSRISQMQKEGSTDLIEPQTSKTIKLNNQCINVERSRINNLTTQCNLIQDGGFKTSHIFSISKQPYDERTTLISHTESKNKMMKTRNPESGDRPFEAKKNSFELLEQIQKLQFENENLKSYNRVLLQKLSNSRPRKY